MRDDMRALADDWARLEAAVTAEPEHAERNGKASGHDALRLNLAALDTQREVAELVHFVARVVVDERPARPDGTTTPGLLRWLADMHVPWLAQHELAAAIADDMRQAVGKVGRVLTGCRAKVIRLGIPCAEYGTSDLGERIPCTGHLRTVVTPGSQEMPDLVCSHDPGHRIPPSEWMRESYRRRLTG